MGQSVEVWNNFLDSLRQEGIFKDGILSRDEGDTFEIVRRGNGEICLRLRFSNDRPQVDQFDDWDDFNKHPLFEFRSKVNRAMRLAEKEFGMTLGTGWVFVTIYYFEVFFC